jgi:hypothetical protein
MTFYGASLALAAGLVLARTAGCPGDPHNDSPPTIYCDDKGGCPDGLTCAYSVYGHCSLAPECVMLNPPTNCDTPVVRCGCDGGPVVQPCGLPLTYSPTPVRGVQLCPPLGLDAGGD